MKAVKNNILKYLRNTPHSVTAHNLLKALDVKDKKTFYQALDELKQEGLVSVGKQHHVHLIKNKNKVSATIVSLSRGFAFAKPDTGSEDVFIHSDKLGGAFIGDKVLLRNVKQSPKGLSADVDAVVEKGSRLVTGTLNKGNIYSEVMPDNAIRYPIKINKGTAEAKNGDKVQIKVIRPLNSSVLEGKIVKVYGKSDSAKICADAILDQYGIQTDFPDDVIEEARKVAARKITPEDLQGRLDLRKTSICTIDGADAKDLDDAVSVSKTRSGFKLGVHIADVSHYIKEGGALDLEARERGTSVYFADRVIPMLPKELSNGVCSLNAGEDKLTFSAIIELSGEGEILSYQFKKSVINSKVRGVYSEVNELFNNTAGKDLKEKYSPVIRSLHAARELAKILKNRALKNGSFDLETTESVFKLNENGVCVEVVPRKSGEAEQMIEQLMITANQAAAKFAKSNEIPFIYRVHEQPNAERVETLTRLVDALGLNSKTLKHKGDILTSDFAEIINQVNGTPLQKVVSHQLLRTMAKARYAAEPIGHFGLALEDYCHFTSPIRRYPDTAIHRILSSFLETKDKPKMVEHYQDFAVSAAKTSSNAEVRAMGAERDTEDCYMAEYMKQHIGEYFNGVISGVTMRGVFVELDNSVEGFVPIDSFNGNYQFDGMISQVDIAAGKKLTIGNALKIQVAAADVTSGRIDFAYAGEAGLIPAV